MHKVDFPAVCNFSKEPSLMRSSQGNGSETHQEPATIAPGTSYHGTRHQLPWYQAVTTLTSLSPPPHPPPLASWWYRGWKPKRTLLPRWKGSCKVSWCKFHSHWLCEVFTWEHFHVFSWEYSHGSIFMGSFHGSIFKPIVWRDKGEVECLSRKPPTAAHLRRK